MYPSRASIDSRPVFDPGVAHPARVYNYWLGGKDHFPADRRCRREGHPPRPQVVAGARANRAFLARAVRYLAAECGIRQFLDIGTGLPAAGSTHEVAQHVAPECPGRLRRQRPPGPGLRPGAAHQHPPGACDYVDADLRDPAALLAQASATLDFTQPVAVLLLAVLHFLPDTDDPAGIVAPRWPAR